MFVRQPMFSSRLTQSVSKTDIAFVLEDISGLDMGVDDYTYAVIRNNSKVEVVLLLIHPDFANTVLVNRAMDNTEALDFDALSTIEFIDTLTAIRESIDIVNNPLQITGNIVTNIDNRFTLHWNGTVIEVLDNEDAEAEPNKGFPIQSVGSYPNVQIVDAEAFEICCHNRILYDPNFYTVNSITPIVANFDYVVDGTEVTFESTSTSDAGIFLWFWDFGDGNGGSGENPVHNYAESGVYGVTLTVMDFLAQRKIITKVIEIE